MSETTIRSWIIEGAAGQPILGNSHLPERTPLGVVIIAHGFKGYKDYGMFPRVASTLCDAGFISHRFNFSHSGMTEQLDAFERPDLFEQDTWNKQVADVRAVVDAIANRRIPGQGLPYVLFGHSRGGVSVILTAGRYADDATFPNPAGLCTAAAPSTSNRMSLEDIEQMRRQGYLESPSSRTGQALRVGLEWLLEQERDPENHHVTRMLSRVRAPLLVIHGGEDETVPVQCADDLVEAAKGSAKKVIIEHANHVFNVRNPLPDDAPTPHAFQLLLDELTDFAQQCCTR